MSFWVYTQFFEILLEIFTRADEKGNCFLFMIYIN